jgi:hypothetical protein
MHAGKLGEKRAAEKAKALGRNSKLQNPKFREISKGDRTGAALKVEFFLDFGF